MKKSKNSSEVVCSGLFKDLDMRLRVMLHWIYPLWELLDEIEGCLAKGLG